MKVVTDSLPSESHDLRLFKNGSLPPESHGVFLGDYPEAELGDDHSHVRLKDKVSRECLPVPQEPRVRFDYNNRGFLRQCKRESNINIWKQFCD